MKKCLCLKMCIMQVSQLLCIAVFVTSQEVLESSGDVSTLSITDLTAEPPYSGEGALLTETENIIESQSATNNLLPGSISSLLNNDSTISANSVNASLGATTTSEANTEKQTTIAAATTKLQPVTTTKMITTTEAETTTSSRTEADETTTTTEYIPTTTTMRTTTVRTTTTSRPRLRSTKLTTKRTTTTTPLPSPMGPLPEVPCEFLESDFVCDIEVSCLGEGEIDCIDLDEEESRVSEDIEETDYYENEEEEIATIGYFPPELVGKGSASNRLPIIWKMNSLEEANASSVAAETTEVATTSSLAMTTSSTTVTTEQAESTQATTQVLEMNKVLAQSEAARNNFSLAGMEKVTTSEGNQTDFTSESSEFASNYSSSVLDYTQNETLWHRSGDTNSTEDKELSRESEAAENTTMTELSTNSQTIPTTTTSSTTTTTTTTTVPTTTTTTKAPRSVKKRRKRDSLSSNSDSSETLKLALEGTKPRVKSCRIIGNLHCTPMPTTAFCRGRGRCKEISIEKSEKSASPKGVESWAIAVIVICASAAILTIGLLAYLVITSWKKLKVQPQNGVTTLTYVNSTPP